MIRPSLLMLACAFALLMLSAGSGALADQGWSPPADQDWSPPQRDPGWGHWYERACSQAPSRLASCDAQVVSDEAGSPLASPAPPPGAYGPAQFHAAYSLPTTAPGTQTIAIVDAYDDPNIESDLATFNSTYGLPACTTANGCFRKVNQSGGTSYPASNSGWALEIALDVETAHEICQNCNILLVEASSNSLANLGAAENEAVALGANVVSNSWGAGEYSFETQDESSYFNHPGVAITASAGDGGYGVEFPAASRYVNAIGGTTLSLNSNNTYKSEAVWSGTGSGCSRYEPKPTWQTDTGCSNRTVSDVAADADPNTGAAVYDSVSYSGQSGWFQVGGTSLAAPLIAAVYALTGAPGAASYGSTPYANASLLHDVTVGSNGSCSPSYLCSARVGYDGPTGLGTPNGIGAFSATQVPPTPDFSLAASPSSQTVTAGGGGTYTVTMTPSGGYSNTVSLSATGLPTGASASFSPASVSSSASSSTLTVSTVSSLAAGSYPFTISGTDGTLTHSVSATLTVQAPVSPDFSISASPSSRSIGRSGSTSYTITVSPKNGFSGQVALSASGLPASVNGSFSPNPATSSSTFRVTASRALRTHATITITGTSGSLTHTTSVTLSIT